MKILLLVCPERVGSQWTKRILGSWGYFVISRRHNIPTLRGPLEPFVSAENLRNELSRAGDAPVLVGEASYCAGYHDMDTLISVVREFDPNPCAIVLFRDGYSQVASHEGSRVRGTATQAVAKIRNDYANIFLGLATHDVPTITVSYEWMCVNPGRALRNTLRAMGYPYPDPIPEMEPVKHGNEKYA